MQPIDCDSMVPEKATVKLNSSDIIDHTVQANPNELKTPTSTLTGVGIPKSRLKSAQRKANKNKGYNSHPGALFGVAETLNSSEVEKMSSIKENEFNSLYNYDKDGPPTANAL